MPKMKTKERHQYGGRWLEVDEEFDAEEAHVKLLTAMGRAAVIPTGNYETRNMDASGNGGNSYPTRSRDRNNGRVN